MRVSAPLRTITGIDWTAAYDSLLLLGQVARHPDPMHIFGQLIGSLLLLEQVLQAFEFGPLPDEEIVGMHTLSAFDAQEDQDRLVDPFQ